MTGLSSSSYSASREDVDTARTAVMERLIYHIVNTVPVRPIDPGTSMVWLRLTASRVAFSKISRIIAPYTFEQFLDTVRGRKWKIYNNAMQRLLSGYRWDEVVHWSRVAAFLKYEKLLFNDKGVHVRKVPRIIQPRDPKYNMLVGCYTKAIEHFVYQDIAELFSDNLPVVAKGMNSWRLGEIIASKWDRYADPVCVGFDQNRFDQHISASMMKYEHHIYQMYFRSRLLAKLLQLQLKTKGHMICFDGIVHYKSISRCSGDMNTGLGNSLIQASLIHSFVSGTPFSVPPSVMVNGDDSLIICERGDLPLLNAFPAFCSDLGFVLAVTPFVDILERVTFCQMNPVFNGTQYVMMRSWPTCISKDTHITLQVTENNFSAYLATVGEGGLSLHSGVPVLQTFYQFLMRHSDSRMPLIEEEGGILFWSKGLESKSSPISVQSRVSFWLATGVLPQHQEAIEARYERSAPTKWGNDPFISPIADAEWGLGV